jgi:hypothetical protein
LRSWITFDEILLTHVGAPVAWGPRIIDTADTAVATPLMIEYGLDHGEAQASIRIRQPGDERELLKLLSEIDGRRRKHQAVVGSRSFDTVGTKSAARSTAQRPGRSGPFFRGNCFNCGRVGHRHEDCRVPQTTKKPVEAEKPEKPTESKVSTCTYCKKVGHTESTCFFKHGSPKKM